jgi:hypothetical protein
MTDTLLRLVDFAVAKKLTDIKVLENLEKDTAIF